MEGSYLVLAAQSTSFAFNVILNLSPMNQYFINQTFMYNCLLVMMYNYYRLDQETILDENNGLLDLDLVCTTVQTESFVHYLGRGHCDHVFIAACLCIDQRNFGKKHIIDITILGDAIWFHV